MTRIAQGSAMVHMSKLALLMVAALIVIGVAMIMLVGLWQTYRIEHGGSQTVFVNGRVPSELPDGFYRGSTSLGERAASWQGKLFNRGEASGINRFDASDRYVFKIYPSLGLHDKHTQVLRIDYNQPGNPWWLHFIVDEIVETKPGHFLGKVHVRIPGFTFTLAFFDLQDA
jgi:hypothetical protein